MTLTSLTLIFSVVGLLPLAASSSAAAGRCLVQMNKEHLPESRNCKLLAEDDCTFKVAPGEDYSFPCRAEHASRLMYSTWIRSNAKVLEVGARYGQASCTLSRVLKQESGAALFSSDADPQVWDTLESNKQDHACWGSTVRGPVGKHDLKVPENGKNRKRTYSKDDAIVGSVVRAIPLSSLNTTFDTLAFDCEGCLADFLEENPELMQSLSMIVGEIHSSEENEVVEKLIAEGWELKQRLRRQRVLCKGPCETMCDQTWVKDHAMTYWNGDVEPTFHP